MCWSTMITILQVLYGVKLISNDNIFLMREGDQRPVVYLAHREFLHCTVILLQICQILRFLDRNWTSASSASDDII
jgi:hypothetical protein